MKVWVRSKKRIRERGEGRETHIDETLLWMEGQIEREGGYERESVCRGGRRKVIDERGLLCVAIFGRIADFGWDEFPTLKSLWLQWAPSAQPA